MLTDAFHKRYPHRFFHGDSFPPEASRILAQSGQILHEDIFVHIPSKENLYKAAHNSLAREFGFGSLGEGATYEEVCLRLLFERYDLFSQRHGDQDHFFKLRIGLIELLLRGIDSYLKSEHNGGDLGLIASIIAKRKKPVSKSKVERALESYIIGIKELNKRFGEANLPFAYHNGYIQIVEDALTQRVIDEPFWKLLADPKWANADHEMKEALDRRDADKEESVTLALKALESVLKIISDDKRWTRGTETGASQYIDNLVSEKNGRYIDPWEAEAMKLLFSKLRNPRSHGAGSSPRAETHHQQRVWIVESCMSWIKSIIQRGSNAI